MCIPNGKTTNDLRYERKYESTDEEDERLWDDEDNIAPTHLWNIIAELGYGYHHRRGFVACLERLSCEYQTEDRDDINLLLGEDGRTWDESIHYPAYQDQYSCPSTPVLRPLPIFLRRPLQHQRHPCQRRGAIGDKGTG